MSSYATQNWVTSNYATKSHTHSDYATKNNPTLTGTIHLNSADIRMGTNNSSSNVKVKFGDGEYIYLHEDSDDHLTIYSKKGIDFTSLNNTGNFTFNGNAIGGGNKIVVGTLISASSGTRINVNLGFQPILVLFFPMFAVTRYFMYSVITSQYFLKVDFSTHDITSNDSIITSTGFTTDSWAERNSKYGYVAFG